MPMNFDDRDPLPPEPASPAESASPELASTPQPFPDSAGEWIPEDLRAPWGWTDLLLLVFMAIAGMFVISLFLGIGFAALGVSMAQIQNSGSLKSLFLVLNQALVDVGLLGYLAAQMRFRFHAPFWRTLGWRKLEAAQSRGAVAYGNLILGGFLFSLLISASSQVFGPKAKMPIEAFFQDRRSALLLMLTGVLIAPVVEETIFRGYLYPVAVRSFGLRGGIVVTGVLFGLLHALQLWGGWWQILLLIVVGIVFTWVRAAKRTVLASYLLHVSYNSFLFLAFLVASHGLRHFSPGP
jgi:membrane protease YdiL (CAAX protease family)